MDTSKAVTHIGLCAGYGGIELGLHRAISNLRSIALCEIEAFAIANLVSKMEAGLMDPAPIWPDLETFPWAAFCDRVDILTGGYPCQPFSAAGQRRGKDDPRHLWPYIADGIRLLRPRCCFFENVEGHISLGLSDVIEDLAGMGYRTTWGIFSASECGAPHQRKRVFILAHKLGTGLEGLLHHTATERRQDAGGSSSGRRQPTGETWPSRPGEQQYGWEPPRVVADSHRLDRSAQAEGWEHDRQAGPSGEWQTQPALGGNFARPASGLDYAKLCITCDNRTDELRLLGNGVVPATAERAFITLMRELDTSKTGS